MTPSRLALLVAVALLVACPPAEEPEPPAQTGLTRLHAEGTDLVNEHGEVVLLRGVNLGAWAFHETWISGVGYDEWSRLRALGHEAGLGAQVDDALIAVGPGDGADWRGAFAAALEPLAGADATDALLAEAALYPSVRDDSDLPLRLLLEQRFEPEGRDALLDAFMGAWIGEADVAWLADAGFNAVRVPLGYRGLITNSDAALLVDLEWNELAFARIETLLDWCAEHEVYAVVDLQESPGGHNDYSGEGTLYEDPAMQDLTEQVWLELVSRFGDRDEVAAWSLLAEPMSAPSAEARDAMYDRLIDAIRATGDDHLAVVHDGFDGMWDLPDPGAMGWEQVVYSTHLFEWGAEDLGDYEAFYDLWDTVFSNAQDGQGVPYFIGSFSTMRDEPWAYEAAAGMRELFEEQGWSWSLWTHKRIDDPDAVELFGESTGWGLRGRLQGDFARPDPHRHSYEELMALMQGYAELDVAPNEELLGALMP